MALRDLLAKFTIVTNPEALDKVNSGLDKAKQKVREVGDSSVHLEKLSNAFEGLKRIAEATFAYELVKHIYELSESFAKLGESIKVSAEAMGIGVERFQELTFAAGQSGISQDKLSMSLTRLSRTLYEAKTGSQEAQQALSYLGVNPGEIANIKTTDQALLLLSQKLSTIEDPIKKLALTQQVLGRGSREMVAFLSQGPIAIEAAMKKAQKEGLTLSEGQINNLARMNHAFEELEAKLRVIFGTLVSPLAGVVEKLVQNFINLYNANQKWINQDVKSFVLSFAYALGFVDGAIEGLVARLKKFAGEDGIFKSFFKLWEKSDLITKATSIGVALGLVSTPIAAMAASIAAMAIDILPVTAGILAIAGAARLLDKTPASEKIKDSTIGRFMAKLIGVDPDRNYSEEDNQKRSFNKYGASQALMDIVYPQENNSIPNGVGLLGGGGQDIYSRIGNQGLGGSNNIGNVQAPTSMTFNIHGSNDPEQTGKTITEMIRRADDQRLRELIRSLGLAIQGSY